MVFVADHEGGEAVAKQVAAAGVPSVERLGVHAVEPVEPAREALEQGRDDQVVVVREQAEDVSVPALAPNGLRQ